MPTLLSRIYLAALICAAAFRAYYVGWLGVYLFRAILIIPLISIVLSLPSMLCSDTFLNLPLIINRGERIDACFSVKPRFFLPFGKLQAGISINNLHTGEIIRMSLEMSGSAGSAVFIPLPTERCGRLQISIGPQNRGDLLGLIRIKRKYFNTAETAVIPPAEVPSSAPDITAALELHRRLVPKPGGGFAEDHELRDYRPGDPLRAIHWKLSSKLDKTIIREPQTDDNKRVLVMFDPGDGSDDSLCTLRWLCERLNELEVQHEVFWRSGDETKCSIVSSSDNVTDTLFDILGAPVAPGPTADTAGVRCIFSVCGREVTCR